MGRSAEMMRTGSLRPSRFIAHLESWIYPCPGATSKGTQELRAQFVVHGVWGDVTITTLSICDLIKAATTCATSGFPANSNNDFSTPTEPSLSPLPPAIRNASTLSPTQALWL